MDTVTELLADLAARKGADTAIIYHDETITFAAVDDMGRRAATLLAGLGIGFSTTWAEGDCGETEMIFPPRPEWNSQLWLVTHVDLHRTAKVQTFLAFLKDWSTRWPVLED